MLMVWSGRPIRIEIVIDDEEVHRIPPPPATGAPSLLERLGPPKVFQPAALPYVPTLVVHTETSTYALSHIKTPAPAYSASKGCATAAATTAAATANRATQREGKAAREERATKAEQAATSAARKAASKEEDCRGA